MRGIGKRLCALLLCTFMVCLQVVTVFAAPMENCPGSCNHAAAIGTTHYDTLEEAVAVAEDGATVTLLTDITDLQPLVIPKAIILDLGKKTLSGKTSELESLLTANNDLTLCNGSVTTTEGTCLLATQGKITIEKTATLTSGENCPLQMLGSGKLTVKGGTFRGKDHVMILDVPEKGTLEISVTGGNFTCEKEPILITKGKDATVSQGFVTGGTFNQDPSAYIPSHCRVIENEEGKFTVVSSFTLTFQANGGTGSMDPISVACGQSVKLPKCGFSAPKGKDFAGWKIGSKTYAAGDSYTPASDVTVTAKWKTHTHTGGKATCQNKAVCKTCGASYGKLASHKLKHIAAFDPTCTASGMRSHDKCVTCGQRFVGGAAVSSGSVTVPALGHSWETIEGIPATCMEDGLAEHQKCSVCDALRAKGESVKEADLIIPAGEHALETIAAVAPTCKEAGMVAHERCTVCGLLLQNGQIVEADSLSISTVAHVLSDWYQDETEHWKACVECGEVFRQKAHADTDQDGICNDCGYSMAAAQQEMPTPESKKSGFRWLWLVPVVAAVAAAVPLALKKRK